MKLMMIFTGAYFFCHVAIPLSWLTIFELTGKGLIETLFYL